MPSYHALYAFGSNDEGELGLPPRKIVNSPTYVHQFDSIKTIRGGANHSIILDEVGAVFGAGQDSKGQLKGGEARRHRLIGFIELQLNVLSCAATSETTALITGGGHRLHTYGSDQFGELGRGASSNFDFPQPVREIAAGHWHFIAVLDNGDVWGWGRNRHGQLGSSVAIGSGENPPSQYSTPTKIGGTQFPVRKAVCGKEFSYLVGDSASGEHKVLGRDQHKLVSNMPHHVRDWKDIGATWHGIIVLFQDGTLQGWGKENQWKLIPPHLPPISQLAVGTEHVLAVTEQNKLLSWGWGFHGNCGDLTNLEGVKPGDVVSGVWNEIKGIEGRIVRVSAGYATSFVVTESQQEAVSVLEEGARAEEAAQEQK